MARKQTLKQLLGQDGDREQVDLDLSPTQLTPTVRGGGNYGIAGPRVVTNQTLSQLTSALGKVNPILKEYKEAKFNEEKANVVNAEADILKFQQEWDGLSDEERQDFTKQQITSRDDAERSINKMFRGNYEMNPIALVRAQKVIGASFVNELTESEQDDFNVFLDKRDPLQGAITAEDLREFFQARDEEFIEKNPWLNNSPLAMDGFNSKLRERRLRNQKTMLTQGRTHFKENVLYPHVGKSLTQTLVNPPLDEDNNPDMTKLVAELSEQWMSTDALTFKETKDLMLKWVESVSFEDSEKIYSLLPELSKLKIGNSTIGNTPEVYNIIEETLFQRQEAFEKRIENEQVEAVTEEYNEYITSQNTILTAQLPEGVTNRFEYSEQLAYQQRQDLLAKIEDGSYTPEQIATALELINAGQSNANSLLATAMHNVAETVDVRQGYFADTLGLNLADVQDAANAQAEGGFLYNFYTKETQSDGSLRFRLREDLEEPLNNLALKYEILRQEALANSSVFATKSERVNAYKASIDSLNEQYKNEIKEIAMGSNKLLSEEAMTQDVVSDEGQLLDIASKPEFNNIPHFGKKPELVGRFRDNFADTNEHILNELPTLDIFEGQGTEEKSKYLLELLPKYQAVQRRIEQQQKKIIRDVDARFKNQRFGAPARIRPMEHEEYYGSLAATGISVEELDSFVFVQLYGRSESYYRNTKGFAIPVVRFTEKMQQGLIPIIGYDKMSEEQRKEIANRFEADFEEFNTRQIILGKLRGQ